MLTILRLTPLTAWGQQSRSDVVEMLTLEQAIALALRDNHLVKNAELGVGKSEPCASTQTNIK